MKTSAKKDSNKSKLGLWILVWKKPQFFDFSNDLELYQTETTSNRQRLPRDSKRNTHLQYMKSEEEKNPRLERICTLPKTNIAPENGWLEY